MESQIYYTFHKIPPLVLVLILMNPVALLANYNLEEFRKYFVIVVPQTHVMYSYSWSVSILMSYNIHFQGTWLRFLVLLITLQMLPLLLHDEAFELTVIASFVSQRLSFI